MGRAEREAHDRYDAALRARIARENRERFPEAAEFIDDVRRIFADMGEVKVTYFGPVRPRRDPSLGEPEWAED